MTDALETPIICPICHGPADLLEAGVRDFYFGHEGAWDYFQCAAANCGTAFPNPPVSDEELAVAYGRYYTHHDGVYSPVARVRDRLASWLMSSKTSSAPVLAERLPLLDFLYEQQAWGLGGRRGSASGSIVDVGCGNGERLERFQAIGWGRAVGVEFDNQAVTIARTKNRAVRQGTAEVSSEDDASHDLVFMHHVIEHVRNPAAAMAEAWRVLKPGGELFILTPNINSALRREVGPRWRGFEAPRHLAIFTVEGLERLATQAGFMILTCRTSARSAGWMRAISRNEPKHGFLANMVASYRLYRSQKARIIVGEQIGDEIILVARKPLAASIVA